MNVINGGRHADNTLAIQEFMIAPAGFTSFPDALRAGSEIFHELKKILNSRDLSTGVGDEGGFAPKLPGNTPHEDALKLLTEAIRMAGYQPGKDVWIALDCAASEFCEMTGARATYDFEGKKLTAAEMLTVYQTWIDRYPICSIEDGFSEHDWDGWSKATEALGKRCQLVGDDLYATNPKILKQGIDKKASNAILIKVNQIGTVTESLETMRLARSNSMRTIVSHRSGESEDTFIADLAVATDAGQIKTGSLCRSERIAKYNQLLRLHESLGANARFSGRAAFLDA
jgi:enolase